MIEMKELFNALYDSCRMRKNFKKGGVDVKIPEGAEFIISRLNLHGYRGDIVGGCVRDFLLGKEPNDYDITTDALPDKMREIFCDVRTLDTGIKHGTLTVIVDKVPYEVTTYRIDGEYTDNRHPDRVSFTDKLSDDLSRRDFTVNAMCYNDRDGLTDIFGGAEDLSRGIIRAVGNPVQRFSEDALRILRALRFAATLDFEIDFETSRAIFETAHLLKNVSRERIYIEWKKLMAGIGAARILRGYSGIIATVIPELCGFDPSLLPPEFCEAEPDIRELALFALASRDKAKDSFDSAMQGLRSDNKHRGFGKAVLEGLDLSTENETDLRLLLVKIGAECALSTVKLKVLLNSADAAILTLLNQILASNPCYRISDMDINGNDLVEIGIKGKAIGDTLETLLRMIAEGKLENKKEELLKVAKSL